MDYNWQIELLALFEAINLPNASLPPQLPTSPFTIIYFAEKKIAFHLIPVHAVADEMFFQNMTQQFQEAHIKLIHLWQDLWISKKELVKNRIQALLGVSVRIHARLCEVRRITQTEAVAFLEHNHLQGSTSAKFKFGLFVKENYVSRYEQSLNHLIAQIVGVAGLPLNPATPLVAVATFSAARRFVREDGIYRSFEMIRFANLRGCTVVGGLDKLLQAFIKDQKPDDIMTYADRDWSDGRSYEQLGFELIEQTPPQTIWVDNQDFTRKYLKDNEAIAESDLTKIVNVGNLKYLKRLK